MHHNEAELLPQQLTERILGGFFSTYNELGFGYLESVYQAALTIALRTSGLHVDREVPLEIFFGELSSLRTKRT
jgi:GxxExxY protein